jgi:hypothetical protein
VCGVMTSQLIVIAEVASDSTDATSAPDVHDVIGKCAEQLCAVITCSDYTQ